MRSLTRSGYSPALSVRSPVPASLAEQQPSATQPYNDDHNDDDDENDGLSTVPQVMVGPDGNIIVNPGRSVAVVVVVVLNSSSSSSRSSTSSKVLQVMQHGI